MESNSTVFIDDQYLGDINSGTRSGQSLFTKAIEGTETNKHLAANIENVNKTKYIVRT